jgi:hypothetical protein
VTGNQAEKQSISEISCRHASPLLKVGVVSLYVATGQVGYRDLISIRLFFQNQYLLRSTIPAEILSASIINPELERHVESVVLVLFG